jgi:hypothetical protein
LTEWKEFANLDLGRLNSLLKYPIVVDGRNLYEPERMANAGLIYHSIGRPAGVPRHMSLIAQVAETKAQFPAALVSQQSNSEVGMNTAG